MSSSRRSYGLRVEPLQQVLPAGDAHHLVAVLLEDPGEGAGQRLVVIRDEDLRRELIQDTRRWNRSGSTLPPLRMATVRPGRDVMPREQGRHRGGARRLHPESGLLEEEPHRRFQLGVGPRCTASRTRPSIAAKGMAPIDGVSSPSARLGPGSIRSERPAASAAESLRTLGRLDADDAGGRDQRGDRGRNTREQTASAGGHEHRSQVRALLERFRVRRCPAPRRRRHARTAESGPCPARAPGLRQTGSRCRRSRHEDDFGALLAERRRS